MGETRNVSGRMNFLNHSGHLLVLAIIKDGMEMENDRLGRLDNRKYIVCIV